MQCTGTKGDVKMLPAFTSKRSPGCFSDVLQDTLEGNPHLQLVVVRPSGEDPKHLFQFTAGTVDGGGRQEMVYLENPGNGFLELQADAPLGSLSEKHIMARTFAAPPLLVHGKGCNFVKCRVLPRK